MTGEEGGEGKKGIVPVQVRDEMKRSFIDYAMSVIVSRAIPDVRDGLKPVHRRIIFGMHQLGLYPNKGFRKAAKTVGDVMGNFHPHGDSAIYEALVRLAQKEASRYPLVNGHGNFGDLDNPPAAMRYTEAKLTPLAMEMLEDIDLNTVEMRLNFDETQEEPAVLPTRVPILLMNGSAGIAVGMATNIPPHNLRELVDGIIAKIDNPELDSIGLMQYIKGPDFPGGGYIVGSDGIRDAYTTGRGSILCRGKAEIETIPGGGGRQSRTAIVVTSLPYLVGPEAFAKRVQEVREDKIKEIAEVNDETDRNGLRVVIELKREAHPDIVLNNLYKHTQLQQSFPVNALGLRLAQAEPRQKLGTVGDKEKKPEPRKCRPLTLTIEQMIHDFIKHRIEVVENATRFKMEQAENRKHLLEGYLKALKKLDEVIATIRAAASATDAKVQLIEKFGLDELQAQAVLEMQLRKLAQLESNEINDEYNKKVAEIAEYQAILANPKLVLDIIKEQLTNIKDKHGDDRRTEILGSGGDTDISAKDLVPNEKMLVMITKNDMIKRVPLDTFKRQRRAGRGVSGMKTKEEDKDSLQHCLEANTHDKLLVFTTKGSVYSMDVMDIPEQSRQSGGKRILNMVNMSQEEQVTAVIPVSDEDLKRTGPDTGDEDSDAPIEAAEDEELSVSGDEDYFVMLTTLGAIKKVPISQFSRIRKKGIAAIKLGKDEQLGWVRRSSGKANIIIGSADGMCIRYGEDEVRPMGRSARGVKAMSLREGDRIVGFDVVENPADCHMLFVTSDGFGKRVELDEFRVQGRGGLGIIGIKFKNELSKLACLLIVRPKNEILITTAKGVVIRQPTDQISGQGRMATGVRLLQLEEDDSVVSVTAVAETPQDDSDPPVGKSKGDDEDGDDAGADESASE